MALNFPDSPSLGQVYTDTTSGFSYEWDGVVWQSYASSTSSQIKILDDISGSFNGSTQTFALSVSSVAFSPANAQQLRVVLGGVVQEPSTDYTTSGSDITFTTPPSALLDCSIVSLGPKVSAEIADGSVTPAKLSTGGPSWNTSGDLAVTGNVSIGGTLTYEDVTNVDSIGIITARSGIDIKGGIGATFADDVKAFFGTGGDLQIYHDGSDSYIDDAGTGELKIRSSVVRFRKYTGETMAVFVADGGAVLYHNNSNKFETTSSGVVVTGICTATSFSGDGSGLSGVSGYNDLDNALFG